MNPLMVNRTDGRRLVIDLDRVVMFEEVNAETVNVWLENKEANLVHALKISLDELVKLFAEEE